MTACTSIPAIQNLTMFSRHQNIPQQSPLAFYQSSQASGQKKRRKNSGDKRNNQIPQVPRQQQISTNSHLAVNQMVDLNHIHSCPPNQNMDQHGLVSTGLRLTFDDDRSTVTSSRPIDVRSTIGNDDFSAQMLQQNDEIKQILQIQVWLFAVLDILMECLV